MKVKLKIGDTVKCGMAETEGVVREIGEEWVIVYFEKYGRTAVPEWDLQKIGGEIIW